jgi:hypothetical protein
MKQTIYNLCAVGVVLALATLESGCQTGQPGSASFASVTIQNHSLAEIQQAASQVFREHGYRAAVTGPNEMLFEREGTRGQDLAYNGLVNTHYGEKTKVRLRSELIDLGNNSWRLQGQAYIVRNAGDPFFEEETRLSHMRRGPYQEMLNLVAKRLDKVDEGVKR